MTPPNPGYAGNTGQRLRRLRLVALALGMGVLAAWRPAPAAPLQIGGPPNISLLLIIAAKQGFFAHEGLDVRFRTLQGGKVSFDAVSAGQVDVCAVTDANIALIGRSGLGPVHVIGSIMDKEDDGIIGRQNAGIAQASDLAGKRIGYTPAGTSEVFLDLFLQHAGIKPGAVTFVPLTAPAMSAAMNHGNVDAVSVWQPFRLNIGKALGSNGIEFEDDDAIYKAHILLIADRATIQARAGDLKLMFIALAKAAQFAQANPAASRALVSPELGIDPAALVATWNDYKFTVGKTDMLAGDLGRIDAAVAATQPDRSGTSATDYAALFDFSAEQQALGTMKTP